ncbi:phosphatidate cytidylyltransferase [Alphaproteobacteria bacterium]|nr:phosphatidate cytidylyltransferase [Alphaproteobacteria bacterium]
MVYKNLFYRFILSLLLLLIYYISISHKYLLLFFGTFIYLLICYEVIKFFKKLKKLIFLYLFCSYFCFIIFLTKYFDLYIINMLVLTIIIFDTMSYLAGTYFGKNFIFKKISPKKTLEGYIGGVLLTNLLILCYFALFKLDHQLKTLLFFINFTILFSILGDLIESFLKRYNKIKDSSTFLPGHGGFFDRFDSLIASIIFLFLYRLY